MKKYTILMALILGFLSFGNQILGQAWGVGFNNTASFIPGSVSGGLLTLTFKEDNVFEYTRIYDIPDISGISLSLSSLTGNLDRSYSSTWNINTPSTFEQVAPGIGGCYTGTTTPSRPWAPASNPAPPWTISGSVMAPLFSIETTGFIHKVTGVNYRISGKVGGGLAGTGYTSTDAVTTIRYSTGAGGPIVQTYTGKVIDIKIDTAIGNLYSIEMGAVTPSITTGSGLSGSTLGGASLSGLTLSGIILSGSTLSGAILSGVNLSGSTLSGNTILSGGTYSGNVLLSPTDLAGLVLSGSVERISYVGLGLNAEITTNTGYVTTLPATTTPEFILTGSLLSMAAGSYKTGATSVTGSLGISQYIFGRSYSGSYQSLSGITQDIYPIAGSNSGSTSNINMLGCDDPFINPFLFPIFGPAESYITGMPSTTRYRYRRDWLNNRAPNGGGATIGCTGSGYVFFKQPNIDRYQPISAKIRLTPRTLTCAVPEVIDPAPVKIGGTSISYYTPPSFSAPDAGNTITSINPADPPGIFDHTGTLATINGGGYDYADRLIIFATGGEYTFSGLKYVVPYAGNLPVNIIDIYLRQRVGASDIDIGSATLNIPNWTSNTPPPLIKAKIMTDAINPVSATTKSGDYYIQIIFYSRLNNAGNTTDLQIGTHIIPDVTIIPTNNFVVSNASSFPTGGTTPMADNQETNTVCADIRDEFGNRVDHDYQSQNGRLWGGSPSLINPEGLSKALIPPSGGINRDRWANSYGEALRILDDASSPSGSYHSLAPSTSEYTRFQNSQVCFELRSYVPFSQAATFGFELPTHNRDYDITPTGSITPVYGTVSPGLTFDKPYIGSLAIDDDTGGFKVGVKQTMRMDISKNDTRCPNCANSYTIEDYTGSTLIPNPGYSVIESSSGRQLIGNVSIPLGGFLTNTALLAPKVDFVLDYNGTSTINPNGGGISTNPWISYLLDGELVRYRLSPTPAGSDMNPLQLGSKFSGLKALGGLQGNTVTKDKQIITGQEANSTDVARSLLRARLQKNVALLTRSRPVQNITQCDYTPPSYNYGTCYIEGDVTLSGTTDLSGSLNQNYDTLIVKNGNLTIKGSGAVFTKNLGIIMLNDEIDDISLMSSGNVFISPDITSMKTIIFADGGIISVKPDGSRYLGDSPERTRELSKQLTIYGSLYTRNTIGGAIGQSSGYKFAIESMNGRFDALEYDLNFLRTDDGNIANGEPLIIRYNPENVIAPLKGFTTEI